MRNSLSKFAQAAVVTSSMLLGGCSEPETSQQKRERDDTSSVIVAKLQTTSDHHDEHPSFEMLKELADAQRKEYEQIISIGNGTDPKQAFGEKKWAAATQGNAPGIIVCSDERNKPPRDMLKIGIPGTIPTPGIIKGVKSLGNVQYVGWHDQCAANGSDNEKSIANARSLATGIGLPHTAVKSFGFTKDVDYRMDLPDFKHHHPAKGLGINTVPKQFNPNALHEKFSRFDITAVGQTPDELRKQVALLVDVAMKNESPEMRKKYDMPFLVYAAGSEQNPDLSYQQTFVTIEPVKADIAKKYGKDAVRYVGFNVPESK